MDYINGNREKKSYEEIIPLQLKNIKKSLKHVLSNSPLYRRLYSEAGLNLEDINTIEDLRKIPFIEKKDFAENLDEFYSSPRSSWIDICPSSGTTGRTVYFPMTAADLVNMAALCARGAAALQINCSDTVQVMLTSDNLLQPSKVMTYMFQFHLGALALRAGPIGTEKQIKIMRELKPTILFGISNYLLSLGRNLKEYGFDPQRELNLKLILSTGSSIHYPLWTPSAINKEISRLWGAPYYSILGSTELNTGLWECPARTGHHVPWDYIIPEIIDPVTGKNLPAGVQGELVLTMTGREAAPLIRYKTGDITVIDNSPCPCGRNSPRITAIAGRIDEMIKIKGTSVFPQQIEEAVLSLEGIKTYLAEVVDTKEGEAQLIITAAVEGEQEYITQRLKQKMKDHLLFTPIIKLEEADKIEAVLHSEGRVKPRKFWDRRKMKYEI